MSIKQEDRYGMRGYRTGNGPWYPSVSAILDILCPMPKGWIDEAALEEGSVLHRALFLMSKGDYIGQNTSAFPRADAAIAWLRSEGYEVIESETHRISALGYGGTPDALLCKGRKYYVPDFKFAESLPKRYEVQLELYRRLVSGSHRPPIHPLLVQVTKKGIVNPKYLKPNPSHHAAAMNALNIIRWRISHGK